MMWYHLFARSYGCTLQYNNSYSGSRIINDAAWGPGIENSFIGRASNIGDPDLIFVFGGTNDVWNNAALGDFVYSDWTSGQLQQFRPAVAYLINYLMQHNPGADIIFIVNTLALSVGGAYYSSVHAICDHYNIGAIDINVNVNGSHPSRLGMQQISDAIIQYMGA